MPTIVADNVWKVYSMTSFRPKSLSQMLTFRRWGDAKQIADARGLWALKGVSFQVARGESVGIIGTNGSGKSTLLKLLTGIMKPTRGSIRVNGRVSALIELGAGFHPDFSGRDNVLINGMMLGMSKKEIKRKLDDIVCFAELEKFIDMPVKYYSSGMQARLGFAVATSVEPDILIVDEVLAVGDVAFQEKCRRRIVEMNKKGVTLLFVSHSPGDVEALCEKAIWLDKGSVVEYGDSRRVLTHYLEKQTTGIQA